MQIFLHPKERREFHAMPRVKTPYSGLRPKGMKEAVWREIVSAWENGLSDREAAFRASRDSNVHITEAEIREIVETNPNVSGLKDFLQSDIVSRAKLNIADSIKEGNISTSKWYLERKAADEFSTKAAIAFDGAVIGATMEEKEEKFNELLESFGKQAEESPDVEI